MKRTIYKWFLILSALEGIVALIFLFQIPSMDRSAWLFGYSIPRVFLGSLFAILLSVLIWISIKSMINERWMAKWMKWIDVQLSKGDRFFFTLSILIVTFIYLICLYVYLSSSLPPPGNMLYVIFLRSRSVFAWMAALCLQGIVVLLGAYRPLYQVRGFLKKDLIIQTLLCTLIVTFTIFHWAVLYFRIPLFHAIPSWFWSFTYKIDIHNELFLIMFTISIIVVVFILKNTHKRAGNFVLLILLGYFIQVGFGFIQGQGFESIRLKFIHSGHRSYAEFAADQSITLNTIRNYEALFHGHRYLGTKPPGALLTYIVTQEFVDFIDDAESYSERHLSLTRFTAYVFPFISFLVVIVLYSVSKEFLDHRKAIFASILYVFFPNVLLMSLELDQFLFPLLFILGFLLVIQSKKRKSFLMALITGGYFFIALFFSFSLLPIIPLSLSWATIDFFQEKDKRQLSDLIKVFLGFFVGFFLLMVAFRVLINYDFLLRLSHSIEGHRMAKGYQPGIYQFFQYMLLNNVEFGTWIGFPVCILLMSHFVSTILSIFRNETTHQDGLFIAFFVTYILLDLFGQTKGEVGRLWLFNVPIISILAAGQVIKQFNRKELVLIGVVVLQLLTTWFIFNYQGYF